MSVRGLVVKGSYGSVYVGIFVYLFRVCALLVLGEFAVFYSFFFGDGAVRFVWD